MKHSVSVMLLVVGLVGSGIVLMHDVREAQAAVRAPVRAAQSKLCVHRVLQSRSLYH